MVQLQTEGIDISCHKVELSAQKTIRKRIVNQHENACEGLMRHINKDL